MLFIYYWFHFLINYANSALCVLSERSAKRFIQSLPLYTSCLFFCLENYNIVNIEKPGGICSPNFAVNEFSGLILHSSIFSIKLSRTA